MYNFNVAIVGTISAGKTTLLNALYTESLGRVHTQKTTLVPNVFHENNDSLFVHETEYIKETTEKKNEEFKRLLENNSLEHLEEIHYNIKKINDFIVCKNNMTMTIYDTPGLNDATTRPIYYKYINDKFHCFDIIIWIIDVNSAINTSDEIDICKNLITNIKKNYDEYGINTKLVVLINKCDDMWCNSNNVLELDDEKSQMFSQAQKIIDEQIRQIHPEYNYAMIPISSENAYIYRMFQQNKQIEKFMSMNIDNKYLNKLGCIEFTRVDWNKMTYEEKKSKLWEKLNGQDLSTRMTNTGFNNLKKIMQAFFNDNNEIAFILNGIHYEIINFTFETFNILSKSNTISAIDASHQNNTDTTIDYHDTFVNSLYHYDNIRARIYQIAHNYGMNKKEINNTFEETFEILYNSLKKITNAYKLLVRQYLLVGKIECEHQQIEIYTRIKISYNKFLELFYDIQSEVMNDYNKVNTLIDNYHIQKIERSQDIEVILIYIDKLKDNNFQEWKNVLVESIVRSNLMSLSCNEKMIILDRIHKKYELLNVDVLDILFNIIDAVYSFDFINNNNVVMLAREMFWNNVLVRSSNIYALAVFKLQKVLNTHNKISYADSPIHPTYDYALERYLYNLLVTTYPNDYKTHDNLLDKN
jgi:predicted GTPase